MKKKSLLIIGGGAAGLMAALQLKDKLSITIFEGQERLGGRIHTTFLAGHCVEAGAEFIHGNLPLTMKLVEDAGLETVTAEGETYVFENGEFVKDDQKNDGRDSILKKIKELDNDMSLLEFLDVHYPEPFNRELRKKVIGYSQGFDLADPSTVSIKMLYEEWSLEAENNYRIKGGYGKLIGFMEKELIKSGVTILKVTIIRQVDWQKDNVLLFDQHANKFLGDLLLVTLPVAVLRSMSAPASIRFTPKIDRWQKSAELIGYGTVIKVVLLFKERFWKTDTGFIISDQPFKTWWTQSLSDTNLLTGWLGGPDAETMSAKEDDELMRIALASVSRIFSIGEPELKANLVEGRIFDWLKNNFACGGYSFSTTASFAARRTLQASLEDTVFFAGEGVYRGAYPGTVEAALATGQEVADLIQSFVISAPGSSDFHDSSAPTPV